MFRKSHVILVLAAFLVVAVAGVAFAGSNMKIGTYNGIFHSDFTAKLATNLGVDQEKLTTAMETTKTQMLEQALQKGDLTSEQADRMAAKKMTNHKWFNGIHGEKQAYGGRHGKFGHMGKDAENILGMPADQLRAELQSGKSWEQIISERGLTTEQFHQKMLESKKEALAKAVTDGKMTQDQADGMLENMNQCPLITPGR